MLRNPSPNTQELILAVQRTFPKITDKSAHQRKINSVQFPLLVYRHIGILLEDENDDGDDDVGCGGGGGDGEVVVVVVVVSLRSENHGSGRCRHNHHQNSSVSIQTIL